MEQPGVDDRVELLAEGPEVEGVGHQEPGGQAPGPGLLPGQVDSPGGGVDAGGVEPEPSGEEGVLARPAAGVEHPAGEGARLGQGGQRRLGPADVPGRGALVELVEVVGPPGPQRAPGLAEVGDLRHGRGSWHGLANPRFRPADHYPSPMGGGRGS